MDITNENFAEQLPLVLKSIRTADFMAYDAEFSGLSIGFDDVKHEYDAVEARYQKYKHNCQRMNAFQIGLCTFKWNQMEKAYKARPFNFYLFPRT